MSSILGGQLQNILGANRAAIKAQSGAPWTDLLAGMPLDSNQFFRSYAQQLPAFQQALELAGPYYTPPRVTTPSFLQPGQTHTTGNPPYVPPTILFPPVGDGIGGGEDGGAGGGGGGGAGPGTDTGTGGGGGGTDTGTTPGGGVDTPPSQLPPGWTYVDGVPTPPADVPPVPEVEFPAADPVADVPIQGPVAPEAPIVPDVPPPQEFDPIPDQPPVFTFPTVDNPAAGLPPIPNPPIIGSTPDLPIPELPILGGQTEEETPPGQGPGVLDQPEATAPVTFPGASDILSQTPTVMGPIQPIAGGGGGGEVQKPTETVGINPNAQEQLDDLIQETLGRDNTLRTPIDPLFDVLGEIQDRVGPILDPVGTAIEDVFTKPSTDTGTATPPAGFPSGTPYLEGSGNEFYPQAQVDAAIRESTGLENTAENQAAIDEHYAGIWQDALSRLEGQQAEQGELSFGAGYEVSPLDTSFMRDPGMQAWLVKQGAIEPYSPIDTNLFDNFLRALPFILGPAGIGTIGFGGSALTPEAAADLAWRAQHGV